MQDQIRIICKKLASSEERIRLKGFFRLKKLLSGSELLTFENALLIMKGLHYMLWMQDQPIKHEDVVDMICSLVQLIDNNDNKLTFIKAFFETEAREWHTIDFWRADKFMMLVRRFLKSCLAFLCSTDWNDNYLQQFLLILRASVVNHNFNQSNNDLKIHLADIICDELSVAGVNQAATLSFIRLFIDVIANGMHKHHVVERFEKSILQFLLDQAHYQGEELDGAGVCLVNIDMNDLCQCLLSVGSDPSVKSPNRKRLFAWYKRIKNIITGNVKEDGAVAATREKVALTKRDVSEALARLISKDRVKKKKKKRKQKPIDANGEELQQQEKEEEDGNANASEMEKTDSPAQPKAVTPVHKAGSPAQKPATPVQEVATPVQKAATPVQKAATPVQKAATPVQKAATPVQKAATPVQKAGSPAQKPNTSVQKPATPAQKSDSPVQKSVQNSSTPVQKCTSPAQRKLKTPSPSQQAAKRRLSDQASPTTPASAGEEETPARKRAKIGDESASDLNESGQRRSVRFGKIFRKKFFKQSRIGTPAASSGDEKTPERPILKKTGANSLKLRSPASARRRSNSPATG